MLNSLLSEIASSPAIAKHLCKSGKLRVKKVIQQKKIQLINYKDLKQ